jgi:tRNA G46 methylase TrmB
MEEELQKLRAALENIEAIASDANEYLDDFEAREEMHRVAALALGHPDPYPYDEPEPTNE